MELMLFGVTIGALLLATALAAVAWKLMRDHRRFAEARLDALSALADADDDIPMARDAAPEFTHAPVAPPVTDDLPLRHDVALEPLDVSPAANVSAAVTASPLFEPAPARGSSRRLVLAVAAVAIVVAAGAGLFALRESRGWFTPSLSAAPPVTPPSPPPLELTELAHKLDENGDFVVTGRVIDPAGGRALEDVVVVVYLFDPDGVCFTNRRAPIEATSLRPGDESAFTVHLKATEPVYRYRVGFRLPDGATVTHVDKRQGPQGPQGPEGPGRE